MDARTARFIVARLDGYAASIHSDASRFLGRDALDALRSGSTEGAPLNPRVIAAWEASQDATRALRKLAMAVGLDAIEADAIGADHYGKRPADPSKPSNAPTATETDHA